MPRIIAVAAAAVLATLSLAATASAQLTFISATGNDSNNCFVQASPCKTLQRGINQTAAGRELRVLSQVISSGYINKSMTIDAGGNTIIGSFIVDGGSAVVTFRRIVLTGRGVYPNGFDIRNAAAVHIEDSTAERYTIYGIKVGDNISAEVTVSGSVSRDNGTDGLIVGFSTNAKVTIDSSRFENNGNLGVYVRSGNVAISNSVASGNNWGIGTIGGTTNVTNTTAAANAAKEFDVQGSSQMTLTSSLARGNGDGLFVANGATAVISKSTFTNNTTGVLNDGVTLSLEDNVIINNTTNLGGSNALDTATANFQ